MIGAYAADRRSLPTDPNGYGVVCVLMLALLWENARRRWLLALGINVLMTVSLSAYAVLGIFLTLQFMRRAPALRARTLLTLSLATGLASAALYAGWLRYSIQIVDWWKHKSRSVADHAESSSSFGQQVASWNWAELLVGVRGFSETQALLTFYQSGAIGLSFQLLLAGAVVLLALRSRWSVGAWGLAVLFASSFIPYLHVYPVSVLFWAVLGLTVRAGVRSSPQVSSDK